METQLTGLTAQEVACRRAEGKGQGAPETITRSTALIIKENLFTLFNLLNFIIAVLLFAVGAYSNMLFIGIIVMNIAVGITQEYKAKRLVDQLSIINRPRVTVLREGTAHEIGIAELVVDDIMILKSGRQISNDAVVLSGSLEVNESLLTGESDAVMKGAGGRLLSGSSVISGKGYARVTHVGSDNYATQLAEEVKKEKRVESELLGSMRKVTKITSCLIIPLGILLFLEAFVLRTGTFNSAVVSSAAALLGMLPKGLVLLISISLANGVIRLSKQKILVQNIYSLETLAHVDCLCLDKTGTLTDGRMTVQKVIYTGGTRGAFSPNGASALPKTVARDLLGSYLSSSDDNNATIQALRKKFPEECIYSPIHKIPFSSKRKWGAISFKGAGTLFVGAPERIAGRDAEDAGYYLNQGCRVIAAGYYPETWENETFLPENIHSLFLIVLEDTIRKNAKQTLQYFYQEGVDVKIISGDHVKTVSMVAKKAGLTRWRDAIDLSALEGVVDYDRICEEYAVFARVTPKQKQQLVMALKRRGHRVAMTGDGVNDLLALREADCSIAVAEGSDASRQIAQIVLLESDFTPLPQVVLEGRKVVHNVTRTAGVFFIKTIYSVLLSVFCLLFNKAFPFIPIQITLIDAAMEAWPSFLTIFESDTRKVKGGFLETAVGNAMPFALVITGMLIGVSLFSPFSQDVSRTVMFLLLILMTMAAVAKSCFPFTRLRTFICVTMVLGTFGALYLLPGLFEMTDVTWVIAASVLFCFEVGLAALFLLQSGQRRLLVLFSPGSEGNV
ncbi:MAG: cation-translocating P-type ATPase [Eubacteriaceae bacterium]|nr:cation-translocating P-type ATPase [Eubacteriaceae bacterium]